MKEDIQVVVSETEKQVVKEYRTILVSDSKGFILHRTSMINGMLKFILVKSEAIDAAIQVKTTDKFIILKGKLKIEDGRSGKIFFPKARNVDNFGNDLEMQSGQYSEIPLNDILEIEIQGLQPNLSVEIVIRYI